MFLIDTKLGSRKREMKDKKASNWTSVRKYAKEMALEWSASGDFQGFIREKKGELGLS